MKKLKGLGRRTYNVLFHTHTVAGIVISFALFVIFYAGAFALFRHEIQQWENPDYRQPLVKDLDIDHALLQVDSVYGIDFTQRVNVNFPKPDMPVVKVYAQQKTEDSTATFMGAYYSPNNEKIQDIKEPLTTVGDTIYFLHYFRQIPAVGLYISGFVALFFLFASITGLLIHWQHLLTKFYAFVKEGKWKVIWTNAHTVLGVISLPFQLMYAVTGAFFGLLILVLLPVVALKYDGDQSKVLSKIRPFDNYEIKVDAPAADNMSLAELGKQVLADYPEAHINRAQIMNYGKEDAAALFAIDNNQGVHAMANIVVRMRDGRVLEEYTQRPEQSGYAYGVLAYIFKLHFATFGGIPLRILYFVLSMVTCFMIVSGILIWRTARDNKRYTFKQRLFHHRVTKWYLAICLSMFPAFAIIFVANKLVPIGLVDRVATVNSIFFLSWLGLTLLGLLWNKYSQQNRNYLIIGGFLSLLIPIVNGIVTGDWIWNVWHTYEWVAYVDVFWLLAGLTALYISFFHLKVKTTTDKPQAEEEASADTPVIEEENTVEAPITMFKPKLGLD